MREEAQASENTDTRGIDVRIGQSPLHNEAAARACKGPSIPSIPLNLQKKARDERHEPSKPASVKTTTSSEHGWLRAPQRIRNSSGGPQKTILNDGLEEIMKKKLNEHGFWYWECCAKFRQCQGTAELSQYGEVSCRQRSLPRPV